jgi:hypothetical protein
MKQDNLISKEKNKKNLRLQERFNKLSKFQEKTLKIIKETQVQHLLNFLDLLV